VSVAEITLNQNAVIWLGGPPLAAIALLIAGLVLRRRSPRTGSVLLVVGGFGLFVAAGWVAFLFYVDAVLGDT
jgi:hypothetical protein